jgi:hypothetical protein
VPQNTKVQVNNCFALEEMENAKKRTTHGMHVALFAAGGS